MRLKSLFPILLILCCAGVDICLAQPQGAYDAFQLPPAVERTRIPPRLRQSYPGSKVNPADLQEIETLRGNISRLFAQSDYTSAEPFYRRYVILIEKVMPDDLRLASALQNYGDLLRKLNRTQEAAACDARAQDILAKHNATVRPFSFKDYELGMTLDEFQKREPPGLPSKVKTICSSDPGQTAEILTDDEKKVKVVQCGFWSRGVKDAAGVPYKLTVGSIECRPDFKFIESDGVYRLFEISVTFFRSDYNEMKTALVGKYGKPKEEKATRVATEMGTLVPISNSVWENGVSRIRLTNVDGADVLRARLRYLHRQLTLTYAQRLAEANSVPFKRVEEDL